MSDLRIAAQQALEALIGDQDLMVETAEKHWEYKTDLAIAALRAALAQEQKQVDPVQVHPSQFIQLIKGKEDMIGVPVYWAEWPSKETT